MPSNSSSSSVVPTSVAVAAAAVSGAAALLWSYDERLGLVNDVRLAKGEVDFTLQSRRHISAKHTVADIWEETVLSNEKDAKESIVTTSPDRPSSVPCAFTFTEVNRNANRVANFLISQGVAAEQTVALLMTNRPEFIWSVLGASKAGCTISFLNFNLRPQQLAHCIAICDAVAVLYEDCFDDAIQEALPLVPALVTASHSNSSRQGAATFVQPKRFRYATTFVSSASSSVSTSSSASSASFPEVIHVTSWLPSFSDRNIPRSRRTGLHMLSPWGFVYTSGTTGLPKAAVITQLRFFMGGRLMSGVTNITGEDRIYTVLPLYHSAGGLIGVGSMVCRGATLILSPKFSIRRFWDDAATHNATVVQYIGELCRYLVGAPEHPKERAHKVRLAIGNGMRPDVWPKFQARFNIPSVAEFYASTEGNASLVNLCTKPEDQGAVGRFGVLVRALGLFKIAKYDEDTESLVRDAHGRCIECEPGETGELLGYLKLDDTTGLKSFAGYHGNKEATEKKITRSVFTPGDAWFRTGDLLRMSKEGRYYFMDRIGDTFRWRGENVATTEVAEVLSSFPGVGEVNVYGVTVPGYEGRAGMAALVLNGPGENSAISLQEAEEAEKAAAGTNGAGAGSAGTTPPPPGKLPEGFDLAAFSAHARANLPSYAIPVFLRILPHVPVTSTFKHLKKDLRDEGVDPTKVQDEIYVSILPSVDTSSSSSSAGNHHAGAGGSYERLTPPKWHKIVAGQARL